MQTDKTPPQAVRRRAGFVRAIDVALRTAHIGACGILLGGIVFDVASDRLVGWLHATVATGVGLVVAEIVHSVHWPYQGRGVLVLVKLALAVLAFTWPSGRVSVLVVVLVLGGVGSHMPKRYRHWSFVHRRVVD